MGVLDDGANVTEHVPHIDRQSEPNISTKLAAVQLSEEKLIVHHSGSSSPWHVDGGGLHTPSEAPCEHDTGSTQAPCNVKANPT